MSQHKPGYGKVNKEYGMRMFTTKPEDDGPVWMVNFMKYKEEAMELLRRYLCRPVEVIYKLVVPIILL